MSITRLDLKRDLHRFYSARRGPALVDVPPLWFLMIDGRGDPNTSEEYRAAIEALYAVAYTIKFTLRRAPDGLEYPVMPLESLWWADDPHAPLTEDKASWNWTAMIMQPAQVTDALIAEAIATARDRRPIPAADRLRHERFEEGRAAQILHIGPYAHEGPTIVRLHAFIAEQGLEPAGKHHEIYLGDPRRAAPEKLRTIVRQPVSPR